MKKLIKNTLTISMVSMIALNPIMTYGATYSKNTSTSTTKSTGYTVSRTYSRRTYTKPGYEKPTTPTTPEQPTVPTKPETKPTTPTTNPKPTYSNSTVKYSNGTVSRTYSRRPKPTTPSVPETPTPTTPTPDKPTTEKPTTPTQPPVDTSYDSQVSKMLGLMNEARADKGLEPLKLNSNLTAVAQKKSDDMVKNNYLSHVSRNYGSIYDMISDAGIDYDIAGENVSKHYSVQTAFDGFMTSTMHKKAILSTSFKEVGIGITETGTGMIKMSVMFID